MAKSSVSPTTPAAKEVADCRLIIAAGDKGSTGKSTTMACLIEWLREKVPGLPLAVFDPDPKHRTMAHIFGQGGTSQLPPPHRLEEVNFEGREGAPLIDDVVRAFAREPNPARVSLVDGVANKFEDTMVQWARNVALYELTEEYGFRVTFVLMMNEVASTVEQARTLVNEVGNRADYLVVRNCKMSNSLLWDTPAAAELRNHILNDLGGCEITMEAFSVDQVKLLDSQATGRYYSLKAISREDGPADSFTRNRSKSSWARVSRSLNDAARVILPPSEVKA